MYTTQESFCSLYFRENPTKVKGQPKSLHGNLSEVGDKTRLAHYRRINMRCLYSENLPLHTKGWVSPKIIAFVFPKKNVVYAKRGYHEHLERSTGPKKLRRCTNGKMLNPLLSASLQNKSADKKTKCCKSWDF